EYRGKLPQDIQHLIQNPDDRTSKGAELSHSYYQGLALELGRLRGYKTYVPAQDANRLCAGRRLGEIADTSVIPRFTYDHILRSVSAIDVIWFNSRGFPATAIEIEHTTDFRAALEKFSELVDFRTELLAVGHRVRRAQFEAVISRSLYEPLHNRVRCVDYERLAELHSKTLAMREALQDTAI
ncbi:MAG: hypothetical protein ABIK43_07225, partial [candidate division WOR-3 bacterium]